MRNAVPDDQNVFLVQPHAEFQQANLRHRQPGVAIQNQEAYAPKNFIFLKNIPEQPKEKQDIRPIRYHGGEFNKKPVTHHIPQPLAQNFPQQVFLERLLPQGNDLRAPNHLQTLYHTQYVPIGVVPPQEAQFHPQYTIQNQEIPQELGHQPLSFVQIPINKDVQIPNYIKSVVPLTVDPKASVATAVKTEKEAIYVKDIDQQITSRFATSEIQAEKQADEEEKPDPSATLATLDFVRYINSRQNNDEFSDTVIIDAKSDNDNKEDENDASEGK